MFQCVLVGMLAVMVVGAITGAMIALGIPTQVASPLAVIGLLIVMNETVNDRYMLQRWRRKARNWLR